MSSIGGHQRQDSPMVDEMLDGAQMDVTDSEVICKDTYEDFSLRGRSQTTLTRFWLFLTTY